MGKYDDIIELPHHVSKQHKPMSMENRAAQFAPFAALTGHEETLMEINRQTEQRKELSEDEKDILSSKLAFILKNRVSVIITFFVADKSKAGGSYQTITGFIKKIDESDNILIMENGEVVDLAFISNIELPDLEF